MDRAAFQRALASRWMGQELTVLEEIDSTNRYLKERRETENLALGAAVVAHRQTAGRGRRGRAWWSPPGQGLYTSFIVYPGDHLSPLLSLLAGVAVVEAIGSAAGLEAGLKWPNDVLVQGRKCAGILVEGGVTPIPWAVLGIGINVAGTLPPEFARAITLETAAGRTVSREALWARLAERLEDWCERWLVEGPRPVLSAWRRHSLTLGETVEVTRADGSSIRGRAVDVDPEGALVLETGSGTVRLMAGDVSLRFAGGAYAPGTGPHSDPDASRR